MLFVFRNLICPKHNVCCHDSTWGAGGRSDQNLQSTASLTTSKVMTTIYTTSPLHHFTASIVYCSRVQHCRASVCALCIGLLCEEYFGLQKRRMQTDGERRHWTSLLWGESEGNPHVGYHPHESRLETAYRDRDCNDNGAYRHVFITYHRASFRYKYIVFVEMIVPSI